MPKFDVEVWETHIGVAHVIIEAKDRDAAIGEVYEHAEDYDYDGQGYDYHIETIMEC